MNVINRLWGSSLGKKYIMAVTGLALWGFVLAHLLGNLQVFAGPDKLNTYAAFLKSQPGPLWIARLGLIAIVGLHVASAMGLSALNKAARPVEYGSGSAPYGASYASRTMLMSGLIIAAFVIYHLLHFTLLVPAVNLTGKDFSTLHDATQRHDVYQMMILGFRQPLVAGFYLIAVGLLSLHLSHGLSAMFQSLGITRFSREGRDIFAKVVGVLIFLGYASIPAAVLLGLGKELVK